MYICFILFGMWLDFGGRLLLFRFMGVLKISVNFFIGIRGLLEGLIKIFVKNKIKYNIKYKR